MNATVDIRLLKTWTPAVPRKQPDNIVSSSYTTTRAFVPSYEKERHPRIEQLLSNDYQRIWWKEKQAWDKMITTQKIRTKKILPRTLIKRKIPSSVTVKYLTRAERSRGGRKENLRKKSNPNNKIEEETIFAKHDTTLEKELEKIKLEEREYTKSEKSNKTDELQKEHEETLSEKEETKSEKSEEIKSEKHEEIEREKYEEAKSEKNEEIKLEKFEVTKSEGFEETKLENNEETEKHDEIKLENEK